MKWEGKFLRHKFAAACIHSSAKMVANVLLAGRQKEHPEFMRKKAACPHGSIFNSIGEHNEKDGLSHSCLEFAVRRERFCPAGCEGKNPIGTHYAEAGTGNHGSQRDFGSEG
jgi:hypothetical protein